MDSTTFNSKNFLDNDYQKMNIEMIAATELTVHNILSGILAISSTYSRFIANQLGILGDIDKIKPSSKNKNSIESLRQVALIQITSQLDYINKLESNYSEIYKIMINSYKIMPHNSVVNDGFSYTISLKYIKYKFDNLIEYIREMVSDKDTTNWKNSFKKIEDTLKSIFNEILALETTMALAFMNPEGIVKINNMRKPTAVNNIKIKSLTDIVGYALDISDTLGNVYRMLIEIDYQLLSSVCIWDPDKIGTMEISENDNLSTDKEKITTEIAIHLEDEDTNNNETDDGEDEVEDFIDTDE